MSLELVVTVLCSTSFNLTKISASKAEVEFVELVEFEVSVDNV